MNRNQIDLSHLAFAACRTCAGKGVRPLKRGLGQDRSAPQTTHCSCVLRGAFRACYARFKQAFLRGKYRGPASYDRTHGGGGTNSGMWSRKEEEYMADFDLVARRYLDAVHYKVFRYYFLLGGDWKLCARKLGIDRGKLYHAVYRVEEKLGKAFAELQPYPLYPPREYFAVRRLEPVAPIRAQSTVETRAQRIRRLWLEQLAG